MKTRPMTLPTVVAGLPDDARDTLVQLVREWQQRRFRNQLRRKYYEGKNGLKDLGISIPPQLKQFEVVVGWPAKAVNAMVRRTILEGFTNTDRSEELQAQVDEIIETNRLMSGYGSAHTSALQHGCVFAFVHLGRPELGEPEVMVTFRDAEWATAEWNARTQSCKSALSVLDIDETAHGMGRPTSLALYLPGVVYIIDYVPNLGIYQVSDVQQHGAGVPVEVLPYQPLLGRPFGRSRITRAVMYLTDAAARTALRTEVGAEFYNAPQRYALGAEEDAFLDKNDNPIPSWTVMLGRLLTLSRDEDGNIPTVGQFAQQSMEPNLAQQRQNASSFAAETDLPVGSLGIVQDNPSSAEAIKAANDDLGLEIENWERTVLGPAHQRLMRRAVLMVSDSPAALAAANTLRAKWGSWATPTEVSQAQASLSRVQAIPALAQTTVELRKMGYSPDEVKEIQSDWRRAQGGGLLASLAAGRLPTTDAEEAPAPATAPAPAPAPEPEPAGT